MQGVIWKRLFRGDSLGKRNRHAPRGRTFAEYFVSTGLMARFADGGSSRLLKGRTLLDLVLAHIGYEHGTSEQELSYRSPMLSFSADEDRALRFAERTGRKRLIPCPIEDGTHFLWCLDAPLQPISPGLYRFEYKADPVNCEAIVERQIVRAQRVLLTGESEDLIGVAVGNDAALGILRQDAEQHYAKVIDVETFMKDQLAKGETADVRLVERTLEFASRDREWLVYPQDPMPDGGPGYSARLLHNRHLSVAGAYRESETEPRLPK